MRGCTDILKQNFSGTVKPGAKTKYILETKIDEDMSTNDISKNDAKEGLKT
jgi:hypothetical protein